MFGLAPQPTRFQELAELGSPGSAWLQVEAPDGRAILAAVRGER